MKSLILNDLVCPDRKENAVCHGALVLEEQPVPVLFSPDDETDIIEGVLRCQKCGEIYPILGGLPILVAQPWFYLRRNYNTVLSLTAEAGLLISKSMLALLQMREANVGDSGKGDDKYDALTTLNCYLSQHYDDIWDVLPTGHPLRLIVRDHYRQDFYTLAFELLAPYLAPTQRVLDIGCGVGRSVYELGGHCGWVYGIEYSFGSAFFARRILCHAPNRLDSYWLKLDGDLRIRRPLPDRQRDNVELIVASGDNLPLLDTDFDVVNSYNVIDRVPDPEKLLAEQERVLKPGGVFSQADPYTWETSYSPRNRWFGGRDGQRSIDAVRERIRQVFDILQEQEYVPWLSWKYERNFSIFYSHVLVARMKRGNDG